MDLFLTTVGLLMIFEGIPWFLSPKGMKMVLCQVALIREPVLRFGGLTAMLGGLLIIYLVRH